MLIKTIEGGYDKNLTYVIGCEKSKHGAVIDAAVGAESIMKKIKELGLTVKYLIITHSHHDHYAWAEALLKKLRGITLVTYGDALKGLGEENRIQIDNGDRIHLGSEVLRFVHTPGHYPDSLCVITEEAIFTGDTLFIGRTGRTVSPKSDTATLYRSIRDKILPLSDELTIYPGHNYGNKITNTLGEEKKTNRFLQAGDEDDFIRIMDEYERNR